MKFTLSLATTFRILCLVTAGFMVGYWMYKFHKNEDVTLIEYKTFSETEDTVYPELTICVMSPFMGAKFDNERGLTKELYLQYLNGSISGNDTFVNVKYESVTMDIFEYVNWTSIGIKYGHKVVQHICTSTKTCKFINYRNKYNGFVIPGFSRCFGLEVNRKNSNNVYYLTLRFKSTLKEALKEVGKVYAIFNYPNQQLRRSWMEKEIWSNSTTSTNPTFFIVSSMEIIQRRNKRGNRCFENWGRYDDSAQMQNIEKVGCKAPYHFIGDEFPTCRTQQELKDSAISMRMVYDLPPPCHEISYFTYRIHIRKDKKYGDFQISVNYPPWTKIITQSQAIGIHALIGNIGGYIGLFVGK